MKEMKPVKPTKPVEQTDPVTAPFLRRRLFLLPFFIIALPAAFGLWVFADWWFCLPEDTVAKYVGRQSCMECHQPQAAAWHGSHHDLAMDRATEKTVLGDFKDAGLEHHGIDSRMFKKDGSSWFTPKGLTASSPILK